MAKEKGATKKPPTGNTGTKSKKAPSGPSPTRRGGDRVTEKKRGNAPAHRGK